MVRHTAEHSCFEAFSWCMETLQEELEKESCSLQDFECVLGKSIPGYDEFLNRLQVDLSTYENGFETVYDSNGEVTSFFNILIYKTCYKNIRLVSSENFDTKDNDYVQYKQSFSKKTKNVKDFNRPSRFFFIRLPHQTEADPEYPSAHPRRDRPPAASVPSK